MSQKIIIVVVGLLILAGIGVWYYKTNVADTESATGSQNSTRDINEEKTGSIIDAVKDKAGSFADILKAGAAQECNFSGIDPETKAHTEGVVYIAGDSFRMRADTEVDGTPATINMIQHEMVMHMWTDEEEVMPGIIIDVSMFEGMEESEKPESPINWLKDPEAGVEYSCKGWSPRSDSFEPPSDVEFIDMFGSMNAMFGEMMGEGMMEGFE